MDNQHQEAQKQKKEQTFADILDAVSCWVDPGWMPDAHQNFSVSPPQVDRGEKIQQRLFGLG